MNELALFAGAGGGILGTHLLGVRCVCAVEIDPYCRSILVRRQNEGHLHAFPIWDDIKSFDGRPWRGVVEIVSGGFPCQDISCAGKGAGIAGKQSGLWSEMARVVREVGPRFVFVENSPILTSRGLDTVLGDLAAMGYDAEWCVLGADDVGAPHRRKRIWILGYSRSAGLEVGEGEEGLWERPAVERTGDVADATDSKQIGRGDRIGQGVVVQKDDSTGSEGNAGWWESEPQLGRVAHRVAHRVDRLRAIGNGQVPAVAAAAFRILYGRMIEEER